MAKKRIVTEAVAAMRTVAGAALDAAAEEARRVLAETVAKTAERVEKRANETLPAVEKAVKARLVKPVDRALKTRTKAQRPAAKKARRATAKKTSRKKKTAKTARKQKKRRATAKKAVRRSASRKTRR